MHEDIRWLASIGLIVDREHIYRRHCSKFRCQRCREGFQNVEELLAHQNSNTCKMSDDPDCQELDISDAQVAEIRKRSVKSRTEEEKWQDLYRILFPEDAAEAIPSPCKSSPNPHMAVG